MARATDKFLAEIRKSHTVYAYVDVTSPTQETVRLPAIDGNIKVDRTAEIRRSCSIKCIDPLGDLTPQGVDSLLTPYGTEIRPYRGVKYDDGTVEVYQQGVFRLSKANVDDQVGPNEITIEGFDLSRTVIRDKFTVPYTIDSGTNVVTAIQNIIDRTFPDQEYDAITSTLTTTAPRLYDAGDSPWDAVTELARSIGCEIYFDAEGILVIAPPHDIDALPTPDFTYIEGPGCTMVDLSTVFTDEPGFNGVIVTGESPGDELPPVRGEAWDEEPTSPTYRLGPYGEVPQFVSDKVVKTADEANSMASSLLNGLLGFSSQVSISAWVNPSFEAGDVVEVERLRSGVAGLYVIDAFDVPLSASATQGLTLREKRQVG